MMNTFTLTQPTDVFERFEKKFLLTKKQYEQLKSALKSTMTPDTYGLHTICNIYYDTHCSDLVRRSIAGPKYKEKLRLRSYGIPEASDTVFLEIKKKFEKIVYKRRVPLTLLEAEAYLNQGIHPDCDSQILREIDYFINFYKPEPKLFLAYDRRAFFGTYDASIRVTFDSNIRSRDCGLSLGDGDYGTPLLIDSAYLLEIKVPSAMPLWLTRILSELSIYPISFSKYGTIYKHMIYKEQSDKGVLTCFPAF
ncbi:MAG: polyphosphate polymerase domain-containing protein [Eubacterium sp.]